MPRETRRLQLKRLGACPVQLTYRIERDGVECLQLIPMVVGVLADLHGNANSPRAPLADRKLIEIDRDNFNDVLNLLAPRIRYQVPNDLKASVETIDVDLSFHSLADFGPESVARRCDNLLRLFENPADGECVHRSHNGDCDTFSLLLRQVMSAPEFRTLEGRWRGLHDLVDRSETGNLLKIKLLPLSRRELESDLAGPVQQSTFRKLILNECRRDGGTEPLTVMVGDYQFTASDTDLRTLAGIAEVAQETCCPFLAGVAPQFFGWTDFRDVMAPRDLVRFLSTPEFASWQSFRTTAAARFVSLTVPRVLAREPYQSHAVGNFEYQEAEPLTLGDRKIIPHEQYVWTNSAYVLARCLTESFARWLHCLRIQGAEDGGRAGGLPCRIEERGDLHFDFPTEVAISSRREHELAQSGFCPLVHPGGPRSEDGTDYALFNVVPSVQAPPQFDDPDETANARLNSRLLYLLFASQYMRYLLAIFREQAPSQPDLPECESSMNRWLAQYTLPAGTECTEDVRRRYPLREARVTLKPLPNGATELVLFARPVAWPILTGAIHLTATSDVPHRSVPDQT